MEKLERWLKQQFDEKKVEPNSSLGGAISYMLKHWEKLTLFLRVAGVPLDNNLCEQALKMDDPTQEQFAFLQNHDRGGGG